MNEYKPVRFRRLMAITVDFFAMMLPAYIILFACAMLPVAVQPYILFFTVFLCFGLCYCRDYLFGGRSPGKRLFGLTVVDRATGMPATGKQLLAKNLFTFLASIDGLVLLFSGKSIAERVTGTAVIRGTASTPLSGKRFLKVIAVAAVVGLLFGGILSFGLSTAKNNESYALAYDYLVHSDAFAAQERPDAEPALTGFSDSTHGTERSQSYTFDTGDHLYTVVCHPTESGWEVCGECTEFE